MRNWMTFLMTVLVGSTISYANANFGQVNFEAGYRNDEITWSNRLPADAPIVSTKEKFKNVDIFQIGLNARSTVGCNFYVRGNAYFGWVLDGDFERKASLITNIDSDFSSYGDGFGFSASNKSIVDDQYVYGIGAAIGYPFYFCDSTMALAPVIGYAYDQQNLRVEGGGIGFGDDSTLLFPSATDDCCRHLFSNRWYGPFVGVDFIYRPCGQSFDLFAEFEYHWGHFRGRRNDNQSFNIGDDSQHRRSRNARGIVFAVGGEYEMSHSDCGMDDWTAGICLKFIDWKGTRHHDSFFDYSSYDNNSDANGRARHKHKWNSYAVNLSLGRAF